MRSVFQFNPIKILDSLAIAGGYKAWTQIHLDVLVGATTMLGA
jgi:hypothetical protein